MTRNALIAALTDANSIAACRAALKAADAYTGCSRFNSEQLKAECVKVAAKLQAEQDAEQAAADEKKASRAQRGTCFNTRALRPATVAKLKDLLDGATPGEDGVIVATAESFTAVGLGKSWVRETNLNWQKGSYGDAVRSLGFEARSSKGQVFFTALPAATETPEENAA